MRVIDTHCHLQDAAFEGEFEAVVERARANGVAAMLLCGYDAPSNEAALRMARGHEEIFPAIGIHPHDAKDATPALLADIETEARRGSVAAIGEIGLDFFRDHSPHDVQRKVLDELLGIAVRTALPVSVHTRGAEDAIYEQLAAYSAASPLPSANRLVGVMHCFGGTLEQARRYTEIGFAISFACAITYPRNEEARRMAAGLPAGSFVVETDAPYLPPEGLRGKRNEPANVVSALEAVAAARGISPERAAAETTETASRLLGLALPVEAGAW